MTDKKDKEQLIQEIENANIAYAAGIPFLSDSDYDILWQQLYAIDPTNPVLYHTTQSQLETANKTVHKYPIFGTNKAFNMADLKPFLMRFGDQPILIEPKYDGCAAVITKTQSGWSLTLEGDGRSGRDVTQLLPFIDCSFDLRHFQAVEIILPWKDWNPSYGKNPRNVVAGWLARKYEEPETMMTAIPHNFGSLRHIYNYYGDLESLGELLLELHAKWNKIYPIDGLMLKVADESTRLIAGNNGITNNWSIAWKPPIQIKKTTVTNIEWNVSRLGRIIPTVIYEPIELCSTTNSRVTGNNAQWLKNKQIQIGSEITIGKAGEIIPKILDVDNASLKNGVTGFKKTDFTVSDQAVTTRLNTVTGYPTIEKKHPLNGLSDALPTLCPKCSEPLTWEGVHLICNGSKCVAKLITSVAYFYSYKGIKIDGIGEKTIEMLLADQKLYDILSEKPWALLDPYTYEILPNMYNILGEKILTNILAQVEEVNNNKSMAHFIAGLGLPGLAYKSALRLCQYIKTGKLTFSVCRNARINFPKATISFNTAQIEMKRFSFLSLPNPAKAIYCITGSLSQSREDMIDFYSSMDYEFSNGVTRETNYLIVGSDPGKTKIKTAIKYNVPQITEAQFYQLIEKKEINNGNN